MTATPHRNSDVVESVDPSLEAALDWVEATPEADQCPVALRAFCAGARWAREILTRDIPSNAEPYQDRLDLWAAQAAACLLDQRPDLAALCLDELACIRRETTVDWEAI